MRVGHDHSSQRIEGQGHIGQANVVGLTSIDEFFLAYTLVGFLALFPWLTVKISSAATETVNTAVLHSDYAVSV